MKSASISLFYVSHVLGIKTYLCPKPLYNSRSLKGGFPQGVLAVVFCPPSKGQRLLLRKIFASVSVLSFSLLEIKKGGLIPFLKRDFSGLKALFVFESRDRFFSSQPKELKAPKPLCVSGASPVVLPQDFKQADLRPQCFFCGPLSDYEGDSLQVVKRKRQLWEQLQQWKNSASSSPLS